MLDEGNLKICKNIISISIFHCDSQIEEIFIILFAFILIIEKALNKKAREMILPINKNECIEHSKDNFEKLNITNYVYTYQINSIVIILTFSHLLILYLA